MAYTVDMDTTASNICGYHHFQVAILEVIQSFHTAILGNITGDQAHFKALFFQALVEGSTDIPAIGKDHYAVNSIVVENILQQVKFLFRSGDKDFLLNCICGNPLRLHLQHNRLVGPLLRETQNFRGKGCREQQGLAIFPWRCQSHQATHLGNKAHIQHTVSFVDYQHFHLIQVQVLVIGKIEQTARSAYYDITVISFDPVQLFGVIHTTNQAVNLEVGVLDQLFGIFANLDCQLPGGRQDQCTGFTPVAFFFNRVLEQITDSTDQECCGFTRTGLGLAYQIVAAQGMGQRGALNRCAVGETGGLDSTHQLQWQVQIMEADLALLGFYNKLVDTPSLSTTASAATASSTP